MKVLDKTTKNEILLEKDMPIHYMMIDGERIDFLYGINMKEFLKLIIQNFSYMMILMKLYEMTLMNS